MGRQAEGYRPRFRSILLCSITQGEREIYRSAKQLEEIVKQPQNTAFKDRAKAEMNGLDYLEKLKKKEFLPGKKSELINTPRVNTHRFF